MRSFCKGLVVTRWMVEIGYADWLSKESGQHNEWRVYQEYGGPEALIEEILWQITFRSLEFRPIKRYPRVEPTNGKVRMIGIESVKQQVVDHMAVVLLEPFLSRRMGFYQVASVPGKGQRLVRDTLKKWVIDAKYHVKADVRQCYPSIRHDIVLKILRTYVKSDDLIYVCETLLSTYGEGLDIGSYFSLKMANLVLSFAYHHVEGLHKVRRGKNISLVDHQMWYMDDLILVGHDKRDLKRAIRSLEVYLKKELMLELKPWKIARTSETEPLDMGGWVVRLRHPYLTHEDGTKIRDESRTRVTVSLREGIFLRGTRAFKAFERNPSVENARRCLSYWGWLKNSDCGGVVRKRRIDSLASRAKKVVSTHDKEVSNDGSYPGIDAAQRGADRAEGACDGRLAPKEHQG